MPWHRKLMGFALVCGLILASQGCAPLQKVSNAPWINEQLFFGMSEHGTLIPESSWQEFLNQVVSPAFPDGFSVWEAQGQWKGQSGQVEKEPSRVLEIVHPASPEFDAKINQVIRLYKERFEQESVLLLKSPVQASF